MRSIHLTAQGPFGLVHIGGLHSYEATPAAAAEARDQVAEFPTLGGLWILVRLLAVDVLNRVMPGCSPDFGYQLPIII